MSCHDKKTQLADITPVQINNSVSSSRNLSIARVVMGGIFEVKFANADFCISPMFHYFHNAELHQLERNDNVLIAPGSTSAFRVAGTAYH